MAKEEGSVRLKADSSFKRLPSFKSPRDLKLSQFASPLSLGESRTKKVFLPNLNVQRRKGTDDVGEREEARRGERDEGGRGRREGERGRGRGKKQFIQTSGVFSDGLAPQVKGRFNRSASSTSQQSTTIPKPKLKLNDLVSKKEDSEENALILEELMRDDFIDDPSLKPDMNSEPVSLPLIKVENLKLETLKLEAKKEDDCGERLSNFIGGNGIKIKKEPGTEGRSFRAEEEYSGSGAPLLDPYQHTNMIFLQIPNSIPQLKVGRTSEGKKKKADNETEGKEDKNTLRNVPPGRIGTLRIHKSGRSVLQLGDVKLGLEPGTQVAFLQEVVSLDKESNNLIHVGNITSRMIVTPDWKTLIPLKS